MLVFVSWLLAIQQLFCTQWFCPQVWSDWLLWGRGHKWQRTTESLSCYRCDSIPVNKAVVSHPELNLKKKRQRGKLWKFLKTISLILNVVAVNAPIWWLGAAEGADARVNVTVQHCAALSAPPNQWWHRLSAFVLDLLPSCYITEWDET